MNIETPGTPTKQRSTGIELDEYINKISQQYDLQLEIPRPGDSPQSRRSRRQDGQSGSELAWRCPFMIKFLYFKDKPALDNAVRDFEKKASALHKGWKYKPKADPDVLPRSRRSLVLVFDLSRDQRKELLECLNTLLEPLYEKCKSVGNHANARLFPISKPEGDFNSDNFDSGFSVSMSRPGTTRHLKRASDEFVEENGSFKKPKVPAQGSLLPRMVIRAMDGIEVSSRNKPEGKIPKESTRNRKTALPVSISPVQNTSFGDSCTFELSTKEKLTTSANTSFTSNSSTVFSHSFSSSTTLSRASTQNSLMEMSFDEKKSSPPSIENDLELSLVEWGSSWDESLNYDIDDASIKLSKRLNFVFPDIPRCLQNASLRIRYEITRVFLHAEVSLEDLVILNPDQLFPTFDDYNCLWKFLTRQPALQGKPIPEKSSPEAWQASGNTYRKGFEGVVLSGALRFSPSVVKPFFTLYLNPLKLDLSYRFARRFGHDRFLELALPNLSGRKTQQLFGLTEDSSVQLISKWLAGQSHKFLGLEWSAFYVKDAKGRKIRFEMGKTELDNASSKRVHFFATGGTGFLASRSLPMKGEDPAHHTKMDVKTLVNWLIPLKANENDPVLKLFSRISLGLSKTRNTVVLNAASIRYVPDDLRSSQTREVMNDGCGKMSKMLAQNIAEILRLSPIPSGFQGRIGGAKGFWIVDPCDKTDKEWIEIYPSQLKWHAAKPILRFAEDEEHRTFEVLDHSKVLKSATLNLQFLPILENRGKSASAMRTAISLLLCNGLTYELSRQRAAMESPLALRKWISDIDSSVAERLKHRQVLYEASMPVSLPEKIKMLLDAGFDPMRSRYLRDLVIEKYNQKCDLLKEKLNISVGRSTYAYMVPDFTGSLDEGEVHLGFSTNFQDEASEYSEVLLAGHDILVARSPAHYVSDIQKVRAVFKVELMALKDVIVFSTKGDAPLASVLSGGDYDGDRAWVCWEPSLVENFQNADIPEIPDLIAAGYLSKDKTTYKDLVSECSDPTALFLERGIRFNLQQSMLGICTKFKEDHCWTQNNVEEYRAVFLSTLLSHLVDLPKQGYRFSSQDWVKIKSEVIKETPKEPNYRRETLDGPAFRIIDHLKFIVAIKVIENTKTDLWGNLPQASDWDSDIVKYADSVKQLAKTHPERITLLEKLEQDISELKRSWAKHFPQLTEERQTNFSAILSDTYAKWRNIKPSGDIFFLGPDLPNPDLSNWALLKASVAFASCTEKYVPKLIWRMAGKQLAFLKASHGDGIVTVTPEMYAMLKPDATYVRLAHLEEHDPRSWEASVESEVGDENVEDDE